MRTMWWMRGTMAILLGLGAPALASDRSVKGDAVVVGTETVNGENTTVQAYAVSEGRSPTTFDCPVFIDAFWTFYSNGQAVMQIVWDPAGMIDSEFYTYKVGVGAVEYANPFAGVQYIDVLTSPWDGEPDGYAMGASWVVGTHQFVAGAGFLDENGTAQKCENLVTFWALPPPMEVTQSEGPFVEGGAGSLTFTQTHPLDHDNEYPLFVTAEEVCVTVIPGFPPFCFGSSADYARDWLGLPPNNGSAWDGTTRVFPAHETVSVEELTFTNDNCAEPTETLEMGWMYMEDLSWGTSQFSFGGLLGNPTASFDILDDGDLYYCAVGVPIDVLGG